MATPVILLGCATSYGGRHVGMVLVRGDCEKPKQQAIDHTEVLEIITDDLQIRLVLKPRCNDWAKEDDAEATQSDKY